MSLRPQVKQLNLAWASRDKQKELTNREKILKIVKEDQEEERLQKAHRYEMQTNWVECALRFGEVEHKSNLAEVARLPPKPGLIHVKCAM